MNSAMVLKFAVVLAGPLAAILLGRGAGATADAAKRGAQTAQPHSIGAVQAGDHAAAQRLLREGAAVNAATRNGVTPLLLAAINADPVMVETLLKAGADPNASLSQGQTILMTAARTGSDQAVQVAAGARRGRQRPGTDARRDRADLGRRGKPSRRDQGARRAWRRRQRPLEGDDLPASASTATGNPAVSPCCRPAAGRR